MFNPLTGLLTSALNEYPYDCRPDPSEGAEATSDPFTGESASPDAYIPIGLFNRFDLAPFDGAHCGEYRIIYARRSGVADGTRRNLIIFEATLANPSPKRGLEGCYAAAKFWANLTSKSDETLSRVVELRFFAGLSVEETADILHCSPTTVKREWRKARAFLYRELATKV